MNKRRCSTYEAKCWVLFVCLWWAPEVFVCLANLALAQHERNSVLVTLSSFAAGWRVKLFKSYEAVIIENLGSFIQQVACVESVMCLQVQLEFEMVMFAQCCWQGACLPHYLLLCSCNNWTDKVLLNAEECRNIRFQNQIRVNQCYIL